ncbi:MAG: hypothetical protein NZ585_13045, partial [Chloracidobacterium sp.]|nr:hypothetical protein [Chloracidobacterium sp.]
FRVSARRYGYDGAVNGLGRGWWSATLGDDVTRTRREVTSYDAAGRVTEAAQRFGVSGGGWVSYVLRRSWTVGGLATRDELPSGREQVYAYDAAGRLTATWGTLGDGAWRMYAEGITYTAHGALAQEAFGTGTRLWHTRRYNVRGQLYDVRVGTGSVYGTRESWDRGCIQWLYTDDMWGAGTSDPWNNGNIKRQQVWQPLGADGARLWMTGYKCRFSKWLALYEHGGPEKLLDIYHSLGAKSKIIEEVLMDIKAMLASPKGSQAYKRDLSSSEGVT